MVARRSTTRCDFRCHSHYCKYLWRASKLLIDMGSELNFTLSIKMYYDDVFVMFCNRYCTTAQHVIVTMRSTFFVWGRCICVGIKKDHCRGRTFTFACELIFLKRPTGSTIPASLWIGVVACFRIRDNNHRGSNGDTIFVGSFIWETFHIKAATKWESSPPTQWS